MENLKPNAVQRPEIYEFEGNGLAAQEITLTNLSRSIRRESGLAGIRSIPIQYWKIYTIILSMLDAHDLNYTEKEIYVQNNSSKAYLTDEDKDAGYTSKIAPINRWRFDKILTTIQLPGLVEDQNEGTVNARNASIGLTLNKEGLQVAFGMNVWACTNFNVMGGTIMTSYSNRNREGLPWDAMEHRLEKWIRGANQIWSLQNNIMNGMKNHVLGNPGIVETVMGDLYMKAIKQAYFKGDPTPFDTHELSNFAQEAIRQQKEKETIANIWDLYNWGTSIMKPGQVDIGEIATNSNMWADYLIDEFSLDVPVEITESEILQ